MLSSERRLIQPNLAFLRIRGELAIVVLDVVEQEGEDWRHDGGRVGLGELAEVNAETLDGGLGVVGVEDDRLGLEGTGPASEKRINKLSSSYLLDTDSPLPLNHQLHVLLRPDQLQSRSNTLVRPRDELGQSGDGNVERAEDRRSSLEAIRLATLAVRKVLGQRLFEGETVGGWSVGGERASKEAHRRLSSTSTAFLYLSSTSSALLRARSFLASPV